MAHGAGMRGVRPVPDAEQPHHDSGSPARTKRRRERYSRDGAAAGTDGWRSAGGVLSGSLPAGRYADLAAGWRWLCPAWRSIEHAQVVSSRLTGRRVRAYPRGPAPEGRIRSLSKAFTNPAYGHRLKIRPPRWQPRSPDCTA